MIEVLLIGAKLDGRRVTIDRYLDHIIMRNPISSYISDANRNSVIDYEECLYYKRTLYMYDIEYTFYADPKLNLRDVVNLLFKNYSYNSKSNYEYYPFKYSFGSKTNRDKYEKWKL